MIDEFFDLDDQEYSREEIEVLNCDFSNTFIRGWNKNKTLDLVCKKIRALLDLEDFLHPKEILVVLGNKEERESFRERLGVFLEDEMVLKDMEFSYFDLFINTFAPEKQVETKKKIQIKHISLKREWKLIFIIDPKVGDENQLIKILHRLFPEGGAKLFFWEYENFINPHFLINNFPNSKLINLSQIKPQKITAKPKKNKLAEVKKKEKEKKDKEAQLLRRRKKFQKIINEIRKEQFSGKSFLDFQIKIAPNEDPLLLEETFQEIFKNEFETFKAWIEINRLNHGKRPRDECLYNLVHRWKIYGRENYLAIKKREKIYRCNFLNMFENLGFKRVLLHSQPQRWWMLKEIVDGLTLPANYSNMKKIIDGRISQFCEIVKREIFEEDPQIINPLLVPYLPGVAKKITFLVPKERTDKNSLLKYKSIIYSIQKHQNFGLSYQDFQIIISPLEDAETRREIMEKVFRNEMSLLLDWIKINTLNCFKKAIPQELLQSVKKWNFYNLTNQEKIINGLLTYRDNFKNIFIDLGIKDYLLKKYPQKWEIFKLILKNLSISLGFLEIIEEIERRIQTLSKHLNPVLFRVECGTTTPTYLQCLMVSNKGYLDPKIAKELLKDDGTGEPIVGYSDVIEERLKEIVEKIKKAQTYGASFSDFQIVVNGDVDKKTIDKYFSKIFLNEFGIFINWLEIISCKNNGKNIPPDLIKRVKKWPKQNQEKVKEILEGEGRIKMKNPLKFFSNLKIKDYLMKYNPDLMAIFSILFSLSGTWSNESAGKLIKHLTTLIKDESKIIKNQLFLKSYVHIDPPKLNYSYEKRGIKYDSYYRENTKREHIRDLERWARKIQKSKSKVNYYRRSEKKKSIEPFIIISALAVLFILISLILLIIIMTARRSW